MHRTHHECVRWTHAVESTVKSSKLFLDGFIQQEVDVELDVLWQKGRFQKCSCFQAPCLNYHNHQHRNALILMCNVRTWSPADYQAFKDLALQDLFSLVYFNIKSKSFDKNSFFLVRVKQIFTNWCQRVKMFCVNIKSFSPRCSPPCIWVTDWFRPASPFVPGRLTFPVLSGDLDLISTWFEIVAFDHTHFFLEQLKNPDLWFYLQYSVVM